MYMYSAILLSLTFTLLVFYSLSALPLSSVSSLLSLSFSLLFSSSLSLSLSLSPLSLCVFLLLLVTDDLMQLVSKLEQQSGSSDGSCRVASQILDFFELHVGDYRMNQVLAFVPLYFPPTIHLCATCCAFHR